MAALIDGELPIGCDFDVLYTAATKAGTPLNTGTCTWYLYLLGATTGPELKASGDVPYVPSSSGQYFTNIPSDVTGACVQDEVYSVRIVFSDVGYDDTIQRVLRAAYKK